MPNTLITNVNIFDGNGTDLFPGEVLVQGNQIKTVAKGSEKISRDGHTLVDGKGTTVMPGLVNCHAHPTYCNMGADYYSLGETPVEEHVFKTMHNMRLLLDNGYTAVVSGACSKPRLDIVMRNEIDAGGIPGPRTRAATPEITVTGGLGDIRQMHMYHQNVAEVLDGPENIRAFVRLMIREGADSVKLMISGDNFNSPHNATATVMDESEVAAACQVINANGKRGIAHARTADSIKLCVKYGIELIYHANFCDAECFDLLEQHKDKHFVNPAIALSYAPLYEMEAFGLPPAAAELMGFRRELDEGIASMQELHKRGVRVLPFGDYGFEWQQVGDDARDLEHFVKLMGFSPAETLMMATKFGGECYGDKIGVVQEGYLADLLMLDGNPLADIALFQDRDRILMVMKDGQMHKDPSAALALDTREAASA
jgi:imidazolonepropionase-like amidohydrolase